MRQGLTSLPAVVLLLLTAASAFVSRARAENPPLPDDRLGIRMAPLLLLSRPDVCADLKLSAEQVAAVEPAITDLWVRAASLKGKAGVQAVAGRRAIDEAQRTWFETNLTPEQRKRLIQIDLQWEGPPALVSRAVVADSLGLAPEQRATLERAVAKRNAARAQQGHSPADEQALAKVALGVLTPAQKERWRAMLGRPFVPQLASAKKGTTTSR